MLSMKRRQPEGQVHPEEGSDEVREDDGFFGGALDGP